MSNPDLVHDIGEMVLDDPALANADWTGLAIVMTVTDSSESISAYRYFGTDDYEALRLRKSGDVMDLLLDLRERMVAEEGGAPWVQCLIQISQPGYGMRMVYEYDDPDRWSPKAIGMDMSGHALSLRP